MEPELVTSEHVTRSVIIKNDVRGLSGMDVRHQLGIRGPDMRPACSVVATAPAPNLRLRPVSSPLGTDTAPRETIVASDYGMALPDRLATGRNRGAEDLSEKRRSLLELSYPASTSFLVDACEPS
jgi:hypothetical protein